MQRKGRMPSRREGRKAGLKRVNLDRLAELRHRKHADYLLIAKDVVIIVEETGRAKTDDVNQLIETAKLIREGAIYIEDARIEQARIVGVLHARRVDSMVRRYLMQKSMKLSKAIKGFSIRTSSCDLKPVIAKLLTARKG